MIAFYKLVIGAEFNYNGCRWVKHDETGARRLPDGIAYPFPLHARVTPA